MSTIAIPGRKLDRHQQQRIEIATRIMVALVRSGKAPTEKAALEACKAADTIQREA